MTVAAAQVSVTSSATAVATAASDDSDGASTTIKNPVGGVNVYLGPSGVTTANGFLLAAGDAMSADLGRGETVYGIVASGSQTVYVFRAGT